ncbi:MAG: polysaccharide biosynthesis C-terminal domain-containing protein [Bacteroidales bacterium]|nr:polysaccharide biosynthesis C-terminal domain-containing protein [Bacteroidales bacterium]
MRNLAKETAIYGVSSILGKFLNWLLVPLYTYVLTGSADYGVVANLYAWTALLLVILTYGMETGFFRFANKHPEISARVYGNTIISVGFTSLVFAVLCVVFAQPIADLLGYSSNPEYIAMLGVVVAMDAFGSIPFAYLRYKSRPIKFAALKLLMIFTNIAFNIFFLVVCPWLMEKAPGLIDWFYNPHYGVGYVFIANVIQTVVVTVALLPDVFKAEFKFDFTLLKQILRYSLPLLVLGIAGIMNQTLDKIIFPFLIDDPELAKSELGIYSACFKISMVMMMFTQAFRYAYEPFIFAQHKDKNSKEAYADAMKFFIIFSLLIFLGMVFYLDIFKFVIHKDYWAGLRVIPIVLFSYIFQGVFFNLSLWYKLTDKTMYGAWFSVIGAAITIAINVIFVPVFSYMASAWAAFACYLVMMLLSYFYGQKHMPINYNMKSIAIYTALAVGLFLISLLINTPYTLLNIVLKTGLLAIFIIYFVRKDFPLNRIPLMKKFIK